MGGRHVNRLGKLDARSASTLSRQPRFAALIGSGALSPVGTRPAPPQYVRGIWKRRHFMWFDARSRVLTQNAQDQLGARWLIGRPLLDVAFYYILFGLVLKANRGIENYPGFVFTGILLFQFTSRILGQSAGLMKSNVSLMRAMKFPRAVLPISLILREIAGLGPVLITLIVALIAVPPHAPPEWSWLLMVPLLALQTLFNLGLALIIARTGAAIPDIKYLVSFLSRFLMYLSGVIFPVQQYIDNPGIGSVIAANPLFVMLEMYREILLDGAVPPVDQWVEFGLWALILPLVGFVVFWRAEESYGKL